MPSGSALTQVTSRRCLRWQRQSGRCPFRPQNPLFTSGRFFFFAEGDAGTGDTPPAPPGDALTFDSLAFEGAGLEPSLALGVEAFLDVEFS